MVQTIKDSLNRMPKIEQIKIWLREFGVLFAFAPKMLFASMREAHPLILGLLFLFPGILGIFGDELAEHLAGFNAMDYAAVTAPLGVAILAMLVCANFWLFHPMASQNIYTGVQVKANILEAVNSGVALFVVGHLIGLMR